MTECKVKLKFRLSPERRINFKVNQIKLNGIIFQIGYEGNYLILEGAISVESSDDVAYEGIRNKAREIANIFLLTILYNSNIGLMLDDVDLLSCTEITKEGKHIKLTMMETLKRAEKVSIGIIYSKNEIKDLEELHSEFVSKYSLLAADERDRLNRILRWYIKGQLAEDKIDKFIYYYIVLDAIAGIFYKSLSPTKRVKEIIKQYNLKGKYNNYHITQIRGALFHNIQKEELAAKRAVEFGSDVLKIVKEYIKKFFLSISRISSNFLSIF